MSCGSAKENRRFHRCDRGRCGNVCRRDPDWRCFGPWGNRKLKSTSAGTIQGPVEAVTGSVSYSERRRLFAIFLFLATLSLLKSRRRCRPDSLVNLYNSEWPLAAMLDLSVNRVTSGYEDYDAAIDAMIDLDLSGALILAATPGTISRYIRPRGTWPSARPNVTEKKQGCRRNRGRPLAPTCVLHKRIQ